MRGENRVEDTDTPRSEGSRGHAERAHLLLTKLNPPHLRSDIVPRPQVIERLERDVRRPLTLISAPAGYGKSTIAVQWLQTSSLPGVWLSLDEGDNDLRTFLRYVVAAVRRHAPNACRDTHDLLPAADLPPPGVLADALANDLESLREPFILALDDYHCIKDPQIHALLNRLLEYPPRSLHLAILTRRDPPLRITAMRASGLAVEVREADLQFSAEETRAAFKEMAGVDLAPELLARIMGQMEGWIVGLRMLCLGLRNSEDPKAYIAGLLGDCAEIQEYLLLQVLSRLPAALQACLLHTSILDRFCAPLCAALCAPAGEQEQEGPTADGEGFLRSLDQANLFTVSLGAGGEWLRYHHLFQQLLQNQLRSQRGPEEIAELHLRAAVDALAGLALTRQLMHEDDAATEALDLLRAFADEHNDPAYLPIVESCRARLALLRGELDWAVRWACSFDAMPAAVELAMWLEVPVLTQARVLIADGSVANLARAAGLLRVVRQQAEACHFVPQVIEATVLQSLMLEKQGSKEEALDLLSQPVALAEPGGWIRPFVEIGPAIMAGMLARLPDERRETRFVKQLLSALRPVEDRPASGRGAGVTKPPLIEALTNREHDVLLLLSQRLYDKEIAKRLNIAAATVRTHLTHIYEKLGVQNRRQAVLKSKESGIL